MSTKREREYARRRHEKWVAHQAALRAKQRARRKLALGLLGVVLIAGLIWVILTVTKTLGNEPAPVDTANSTSAAGTDSAAVPDPALAEGRTWTATLTTSVGDITLSLDGAAAPQAVASFVTLAQDGFFDGTSCHRLTTIDKDGIAVLQCGDPTGTGTGGPGYTFGPVENAPADDFYPAGTVALARTGGDGSSMGSQFFLVYEDSTIPSDAAGGYTVFGTVTSPLSVLEDVGKAGIAEGTTWTPATQVTIEKVEAQ